MLSIHTNRKIPFITFKITTAKFYYRAVCGGAVIVEKNLVFTKNSLLTVAV